MNDKMKYVLLGLAVIAALGIGTFMYKRMAPANQNAYDSSHVGPPAYATSKSVDTYKATVGGKDTGGAGTPPGAGGRPMYSGPGGGSGGGRPGGPPSYGGPR